MAAPLALCSANPGVNLGISPREIWPLYNIQRAIYYSWYKKLSYYFSTHTHRKSRRSNWLTILV